MAGSSRNVIYAALIGNALIAITRFVATANVGGAATMASRHLERDHAAGAVGGATAGPRGGPWHGRRRTGGFMLLVLFALAGAARAELCPSPYEAGQLVHWINGKVVYQVFVRSFADSNGDGIGDFNGLAGKLDYLNDGDPDTDTDLGVDAIWLLPITSSPSYHGYDTIDYDAVEPDYGTDEDFDRLVSEAHKRGIRVIMDLVLNHASAQHPWFVDASRSTDSEYHDWFVWRDDDPGWVQPWGASPTWHRSRPTGLYYYGLFWDQMPDLNFHNPAVRAEMTAVAGRWLARGVDGFRLDASRHMVETDDPASAASSPETHALWREFAVALREDYPDVLLVGENWTTVDLVADFFGDQPFSEIDLNFNFDLAGALVRGVRDERPEGIIFALCETADWYPAHALDGVFLTNHDMIRVMTQLRNDPARARLAASILLTLPGVPFIYYGEEIGMPNGPGDEDPEKRTPMLWNRDGGFTTGKPWIVNRKQDPSVNVADQRADAGSIWHRYRDFIEMRRRHPALAMGSYWPVEVRGLDARRMMAYERRHGDDHLLVVINLGGESVAGVEIEWAAPVPGGFRQIAGVAAAVETVEQVLVIERVAAHGLSVFVLAPPDSKDAVRTAHRVSGD